MRAPSLQIWAHSVPRSSFTRRPERSSLPAPGREPRAGFGDPSVLPGMPEDLLPVCRQEVGAHGVQGLLLLPFREVVPGERLFSFFALQVVDGVCRRGEGADLVGLHSREGDRPGDEAVGDDLDARRGVLLRLGSCVFSPVLSVLLRLRHAGFRVILARTLLLPLLLVALRREKVRNGRGQGGRVDARRLRVDVGELEGAERRGEVAVGEEEEVLAVGREGGREVGRQAVAEREGLPRLERVDPESREAGLWLFS